MHSKTLSFIKSGLLLKKHFDIYKSFSIRQRRGGGSVTLTWEFIYMREEVGIRLVPRPVGDSCTGGGRAESPGDRRQCWYSLHPSVLLMHKKHIGVIQLTDNCNSYNTWIKRLIDHIAYLCNNGHYKIKVLDDNDLSNFSQ